MAERWAVASGNWSNTATWNGGTLPGSGDDVYANNFTVTIDQDVTANSLRIIAGTTAVQGGGFTHPSGTHAVTLASLTVGAFTGSSTYLLRLAGGTVTVSVASTVTGDTSSTGSEPTAIEVSGGTHVITADITGGSTSTAYGVNVSGASAQVTINGAVTGGSGVSAHGAYVLGSGARLTVNGSIEGAANSVGVFNQSGIVRVNADLRWGALGRPPIQGPFVFARGGSYLGTSAASDDDWPATTGASILLTEGGGGGVDPQRFLNVAGVATPIQ